MQVQEKMIRWANLHSRANHKKRGYSCKYALSSIVYYSKCGGDLQVDCKEYSGKVLHRMAVRARVEHGATTCNASTMQELNLQAAVVQEINLVLGNRKSMIITLQKNMKAVTRQEDATTSEGIETKLLELEKEPLKLANSKKTTPVLSMRFTDCVN